MGFNINLHNMESLDEIIENANKNITIEEIATVDYVLI